MEGIRFAVVAALEAGLGSMRISQEVPIEDEAIGICAATMTRLSCISEIPISGDLLKTDPHPFMGVDWALLLLFWVLSSLLLSIANFLSSEPLESLSVCYVESLDTGWSFYPVVYPLLCVATVFIPEICVVHTNLSLCK